MISRLNRTSIIVAALTLLVMLSGCAGPVRKAQGPVFFPPPPNLPRIQYLMGIDTSEDVEGKVSTISLFNLGSVEQKKIRPIIKPYGVTAADGKIYVADISGQLIVIDLPKKSFELLKGNNGFGKLKKPVNVAVDSLGFIYVADVGRKEVVIYDSQGEFLRGIGSEFDVVPTDVAVDDDRLYLLDTKKGIIRVIDRKTNTVVTDIGKGPTPESSLNLPMNIALDKKGIIYATNAGNGKIISFDRDGNFLADFGQLGDGYGQFARPKGLTTDKNGYIYIVDAGHQNVQVFNEKSRLLMFFGGAELAEGGMNLPSGITINNDSLPFFQNLADKSFELDQIVIVANQFGSPKLSIYGLGKRKGIDYEKEYLRIQEERERKAREEKEKQEKQKQEEEQKQNQAQTPDKKP